MSSTAAPTAAAPSATTQPLDHADPGGRAGRRDSSTSAGREGARAPPHARSDRVLVVEHQRPVGRHELGEPALDRAVGIQVPVAVEVVAT